MRKGAAREVEDGTLRSSSVVAIRDYLDSDEVKPVARSDAEGN